MVDRKDQFYDLLTDTIYAQAELLKSIPLTKENIKLLNKHNKHLPNNMYLLELYFTNFAKWIQITIKRLGE